MTCERCEFIETEYVRAEAEDLTRDALLLALAATRVQLEQAERHRDVLREFVEDEAERDCFYGDNCPPNAGTRHGTCTACKARRALKEGQA
jgi:hypothetical protein